MDRQIVRSVNQLHMRYLFVPMCLGLGLIAFFWNALRADSGIVTFVETNPLSYASLALFIVCLIAGSLSQAHYFTLLVFVLLAFPAPVNDFFPGVFLGDPREVGAAVFPFVTHIDIFLAMGIIRAVISNNRIQSIRSPLLLLTLLTMFISISINFIETDSDFQRLLLLQGTYQFRYLAELALLLSFYRVSGYRNHILLGYMLSVFFLFAEALLFTRMSQSPALTSGSLANNTYASIIAAILLFMLVSRKNFRFSRTFRLLLGATIVVAVITIISTGARMAVLAFVVTYFAYRFFRYRKKGDLTRTISWVASVVLLVASVAVLSKYLPKRYNPETIYKKIHIGQWSGNLLEWIRIEPSWETSSLITRQRLYATSVEMFNRNPVAGVGVGRWNYLKKQYGFPQFLLIDGHNGYLSVISQYGLLGLPLIYLIYLHAWTLIVRRRNFGVANFLFWLALINAYISISDLSNSGIFKHQIFALLAFNIIMLLKLREEEKAAPANIPTSQ